MIVEARQRFPRRAIAVIPPDGLGKFAIGKEPVDVTKNDPVRYEMNAESPAILRLKMLADLQPPPTFRTTRACRRYMRRICVVILTCCRPSGDDLPEPYSLIPARPASTHPLSPSSASHDTVTVP